MLFSERNIAQYTSVFLRVIIALQHKNKHIPHNLCKVSVLLRANPKLYTEKNSIKVPHNAINKRLPLCILQNYQNFACESSETEP